MVRRFYRIGPVGLEVLCDDLTAAAALERHFGPFGAARRAPGSLRFLIRAGKSPNPLGAYYGASEPLLQQALKDRGLYPTHAACLTRAGKAVLLCGRDGAGKTSTAWTLATRGFRLLSDEDAFIGRKGAKYRVWAGSGGVSFTLEGARRFFRPWQLQRMAWAPAGERWKFWVPFRPPRKGCVQLGAIVFLRRPGRAARATRITRLGRAEGLYRLLSRQTERVPCCTKPLGPYLRANQGWLAGLLGEVPAYEARLGSNKDLIGNAFSELWGNLRTTGR